MWGRRKSVLQKDCNEPLFQYFIMDEIKEDITLTTDVNKDDSIINVSAGHGFQVGEFMVLWNNGLFEQLKVINVNVNAITVDIPVASNFLAASTQVVRGSIDLNIDGSVTPKSFKFQMRQCIIPIHILSVKVTMQHAAAADDGKFGGIAELLNGLYFRIVNTQNINLGIYKNNQDFKDRGGEVIYTQKAPAGTYATEMIYDLKGVFGQILKIDPVKSDYFYGLVRDDLTGLNKFIISLIGHFEIGA